MDNMAGKRPGLSDLPFAAAIWPLFSQAETFPLRISFLPLQKYRGKNP
jgi:hypothetical protein